MIGVTDFKGTLQETLDIFDWNWLDFCPRITVCFIEGGITADRFRLVIGTVRSITLLNNGHSFILKFSNCHKTVNKYYACKKSFKQQEIENTSHSQQTQILLSVKMAKDWRKNFNFSYLL